MVFDALVLAAGFSTRMKSWKPGLSFRDTTIIEETVKGVGSVCRRIYCIGGEFFFDLKKILKDYDKVVVLENTRPERGMLSSVQTGIEHVRTPWFFIVLGDMPGVRPATYKLLAESAEKNKSLEYEAAGPVVVPRYDNRDGHPVVLSLGHIPALRQADPKSKTLRDVLSPYPKIYIEVGDPGVVEDIDTPEDYRRMCGTSLP